MNLGTLALLVPLAAGNPPPPPMPAPVAAARVIAPPGVRVTALPGTAAAKVYPTPATFALRPGYVYRFALAGIPNEPDLVLYPEVEVRGSLVAGPGVNVMEHPFPVFFTRGDLQRAAAGALVTKVVYLEDPAKAEPVATTPDLPLEYPATTVEDAVKLSADRGRVVAVVRLGDRRPDDGELRRAAVPGTVLLPGERYLAAPAAPPPLAYCGVPLYDPIAGPRFPTEECIGDGCDTGPRLGIGPNDRLGGLDPTDVSVEYSVGAKRRVTTSNRVCVCAPRFGIRRVEAGAGGIHYTLALERGVQVYGNGSLLARVPGQAVVGREHPAGYDARTRPAAQIGADSVHVFAGSSKPIAIAVANGARVTGTVVAPDEVDSFPNELVVTKTADPEGPAKVGDVVTFTIRYQNNTRNAVRDLVVSDSLSGRFEYVPGTAQSDRPANVTTAANEAGSVVVRFELPGELQPRQGGVVTFRAKIR